jgi:SseB protein C-terminal domain/SseB protein N-terminal domain
MGMFDFIKQKNDSEQSIESIFNKAAIDNAFRPLFYRKILDSELVLLTQDNSGLPERKFITDENTKLQVRYFSTGVVPLFTSTERIFDNNIIKGEVHFSAIKARVIFEMFKNTTFIINPYSNIKKELLPDEIEFLLNGTLFEPGKEQQVKPHEEILLGIPEEIPVNLIETLKRYFGTWSGVKGVYLALITFKSRKDPPNLILGIDCSNDLSKEFSAELSEIIKGYLKGDEVMDYVKIKRFNKLSRLLKKKEFKIY